MKHILSKSTFMYGCQCPKRLFLHKFRQDLRNPRDEENDAILEAGTSIGQLAQQIFPGGVDASPPDSFSYPIAIEKTRKLIEEGQTIIYEAAFQYEGVLCALDILVKKEDGWHAYEVKSSTSIKEQHVQDGAVQYFVLHGSKLDIVDFSIIHLNSQYVRDGGLDINQLFLVESILGEVIEQQEFVLLKVRELTYLIENKIEAQVDIGPHCFSPYECDFTLHCWQHVPKVDSVFDLPGKHAWKLYEAGITHLDKIPSDYELTGKVAMQVEHYRSGETYVDRESIDQFLAQVTYPIFFFDFETIMPGIPEFDNSRPYQQIPFQFSLHIEREQGAALEHHHFLGDGITDPRLPLLNAMIEKLESEGTIVCYNMTFEKSRIKELATVFPEYYDQLIAINDRVIDLMVPFQKRWYYHPEFKGSYSIKSVLPVLIPELRYDRLDIRDGGMASLTYTQLKYHHADTVEKLRTQLLAYCELDTLAMVKILKVLIRL